MITNLKTLFSNECFLYTGPELRPHFILERFGLRGSALVAWQGQCLVQTEHLVDWEDRLALDHIRAEKMIHFLGEFFYSSVVEGVLFQRLFMAHARDVLSEFIKLKPQEELIREGDDLYWIEKNHKNEVTTKLKLSVSIVTASPVSALFHAGINLDATGAPVQAIGLERLGLNSTQWVSVLLERIGNELESIQWACVKVRPVV